MAELSNVFAIDVPGHNIPLSSILMMGMNAMSRGGYVKISNHTGRRDPNAAFRSAYDVIDGAIPKYYIYVKSPGYDLWQEYDGTRPSDPCSSGMDTLATESNVNQRMHTRMTSPHAFRIMVFDERDRLLDAYERYQIDTVR